MKLFEELGLDSKILKGIEALGFVEPTPIQREAIPQLLTEDRDLIGLAQTGTGKTAAFGLPLLHKIDMLERYPQALILAPTRELCLQITKDLENFGKFMDGFNVVAVYGGASIQEQMRSIRKGVQVVVATPGRLIDLIDRNALDLRKVDYVVLDEADEMLNMGFKEDIDYILSNTPEHRNTWLFSATMPKEVKTISKNYMENPIELSVGKREEGADKIEHLYYVVRAKDRYLALKRVVDANPDIFAIVFCRTKIESQEVAEHLIRDGYNADALHGDLSQQQRDKVMGRYRERALQLLVATDVAARGIDVQDVTHVIHYNLPDELENYMHRSGRTARAGKSGVSISIINIKEAGRIRQIERTMNKKFVQCQIPNGIEICEKQLMSLVKKVHDVTVNEKEIEPYLPAIYAELQELDKEDVIRRFVSIEFNRFLEYYRRAPDLNVDMNSTRRDRDSAGGSDDFRPRGQRMFISIGAKDGLDKGQLLRFLCDESGERGSVFGKIDVKGVYSFVDVSPDRMEVVMQKINGCEYRGRTVKVELTEASSEGGGRRESSGGGYRGNSDRGPRREGGSGGGYRGNSDRGSSDRGGRREGGSGGGYRGRDGGSSRDGGSREGGGYKKKEYSDSSSAPRTDRADRSDAPINSPSSEGSSRKDKFKKW